jgi:uncharacterized protein (DUF433 family)
VAWLLARLGHDVDEHGLALLYALDPALERRRRRNARLKSESWMRFPESAYINQEDGALRIAGTRVGLSSVVAHFQEGQTPEQIVESFPTMTLAQAYGAIAYYLENRKLINDFFAEVDREFHRVRPLSETNPELVARLEAARQQLGSKRM